jgi:hypothetical protein
VKTRAFNAVLFIGLAVWAAVAHGRLVPGFACMALGQTCLFFALVEARRPRERLGSVWAFVAFMYLDLALLVAAVFGPPTSGRFWIAFAAVAAVFSPVVLLAGRFLRRAGS